MHFMDDRFMNLGEEVILTLLWQSGASESSTVCFVISLSICYWQLKCGVLCVVCVWERQKERKRERETGSHHSRVYSPSVIAACLQTHTSFITVCHATLFHSRLELMVKLRTLLTVFNFESWSSWLWKGALHFRCGLWCSANHNALCQLANQSRLCLSEGGTL